MRSVFGVAACTLIASLLFILAAGAQIGIDIPRIPEIPRIPSIPPTVIPPTIPPTNLPDSVGPAIPPSQGAGDPPGPPPDTFTRSIVVAVCINDQDLSGDCLDQGIAELNRRLIKMYITEYVRGRADGYLEVTVPRWVDRRKVLDLFQDLEERVIATIEQRMLSDVAQLTSFDWRVEQRAKVEDWVQQARQDNIADSNWTHNWQTGSHTFGGGPAFQQLHRVNARGWGSN